MQDQTRRASAYQEARGLIVPAERRFQNSVRANGGLPSRTLLLTAGEEGELVEVDWLMVGVAAAGLIPKDGLQERHRLGECQAGRGARSSGCLARQALISTRHRTNHRT